MSVYTSVSQPELELFIKTYSLGELIDYVGIEAGIENTNYLLSTSKGKYILTLFESLADAEISKFLLLMDKLENHQFSVPKPQKNIKNTTLSDLKGKPAAVFNCLPGYSVDIATIDQCYEIGEFLAQLHQQSQSYINNKNVHDVAGCQTVFKQIKCFLNQQDVDLIHSELDFLLNQHIPALPQGTIHADLFKDNVLFEQGKISGVLDFYNACHDVFIFDIAVTVNDWCIEGKSLHSDKFNALLSGYQKVRALSENEIRYIPVYLRLTALRFWLSRLDHQLHVKKGELTLIKDPLAFRHILESHRSAYE